MTSSARRRQRLVATLRARGALHHAQVERAFLTVPREAFVPGLSLDVVYRDEAILTKVEDGVSVSSSSQPAIMALMLEQLDLFPGARVLEIGAGTGYNAALLREITGPSGEVVTVDIDPEVGGWADERLRSSGYGDVLVRCADGADGWPERAPYDRIELTVGADDIAPAWHEQLVDGGVLVIPLWVRTGQICLAFERRGDGFESCSAQPCGFIPLRGRMAAASHVAEVADGVVALVRDDHTAARARALLRLPLDSAPWDGHAWDGFSFFAGLWNLPVFSIWASIDGGAAFRGGGFALIDSERDSVALVASAPESSALRLLSFGSRAAAETLESAHRRWHVLGRPDIDQLSVTARPLPVAPEPAPYEIAVDTRRWRLLLSRHAGPLR
ncbi:MAG TPA: methyltransferase domain-containing protein [Thermomicrobiales bacterium]|nr:methyltransferase domain-containing protein [Thermomicrobiales bacterium]